MCIIKPTTNDNLLYKDKDKRVKVNSCVNKEIDTFSYLFQKYLTVIFTRVNLFQEILLERGLNMNWNRIHFFYLPKPVNIYMIAYNQIFAIIDVSLIKTILFCIIVYLIWMMVPYISNVIAAASI